MNTRHDWLGISNLGMRSPVQFERDLATRNRSLDAGSGRHQAAAIGKGTHKTSLHGFRGLPPGTSPGVSERMEAKEGGVVMVFQGEVLSVTALLDAALAAPTTTPMPDVGVRHTAAQNAADCRRLLRDSETLDTCWRFGILQTLDDYTSVLRRGGPTLAAEVFTDEPARVGAAEIDAAFAALADHLANRDGWETPAWAMDPSRRTTAWYPAVPVMFSEDADRESPDAFRRRGILITARSLARA